MTDVGAGRASNGVESKLVTQTGNTAHQSRAGYWFDIDAPTWQLDRNNTVSLRRVREALPDEAVGGFLATLAHYARTVSASHARNVADRFSAMLAETGAKSIEASMLINYRASLDRQHEWKLGTIRGFLYKWYELGYPGLDHDVIDLLSSWTLKGNIKGDAVKRLDPRKGPLTENELAAFNEGVIRAFEQGKIALDELAVCLLISHTGRRPKQVADTKNCDLDGTRRNKRGEEMFLVHIPRAKQRGEVFRDSFRSFAMTRELWAVLNAQKKSNVAMVERILGHELQEADRAALPLFPDRTAFASVHSVAELRSRLDTDQLHLTSAKVTEILKKSVIEAKIFSERTGQLLEVMATRFRYTTGTRAAREGFGMMVIAELLDHTDIQNAWVYTANVPEHARALNKAMALQLAPYAQAFQGVLVDREADARRGSDFFSRIKFKGQDMATCGQHEFCGANVPIPCYTCIHFQPWLDGPHEEVLADLLAEREKVQQLTNDSVIAGVNDRTIIAVANVIQRCKARRDELVNMPRESSE